MTPSLVERLEKRAQHLGHLLTDPPQPHPDGLLMREAKAALEALTRERDEALDRVDELEAEAGRVSNEFEGDCWKAMRRLLDYCKFPWRDVDTDGVMAEDAYEYILETLKAVETDESRARSRAEAAEAKILTIQGEMRERCAKVADSRKAHHKREWHEHFRQNMYLQAGHCQTRAEEDAELANAIRSLNVDGEKP